MKFNFFKKKEEVSESKDSVSNVDSSSDEDSDSAPIGKYSEPCALCGKQGTEKKWMGQYWHKKCLRQTKKISKKMV